MKIAFIDSFFPSLTATFVNREFDGLQKSGKLEILPFSLKRPGRELQNKEFASFLEKTFYFRPDRLFHIVFFNILSVFTHPVKYFQTLRVIFKNVLTTEPATQVRLLFHFFSGIYLSCYLQKNRFHAVHAHFWSASNVALIAELFSGIPFTFTIHANEMYSGSDPLLNEKITRAKAVVTESQYNKHHINLLTRYRCRNKIHVVYNSIAPEEIQDVKPLLHRNTPMELLSVGSFTGFKGYPTVLNALTIVKQKGIPFRYKIIGGGSSDEHAMIQALVKDYGIENEVCLLGRQSFATVREEMIKTNVLIMASEIYDRGIRDGIPTVISESMLLKRPVVATYISDIPNIIQHGKTGYLFPEKCFTMLADILLHIYENYGETVAIVENAFIQARKMFDAKKNIETLLLLLTAQGSTGGEK